MFLQFTRMEMFFTRRDDISPPPSLVPFLAGSNEADIPESFKAAADFGYQKESHE